MGNGGCGREGRAQLSWAVLRVVFRQGDSKTAALNHLSKDTNSWLVGIDNIKNNVGYFIITMFL